MTTKKAEKKTAKKNATPRKPRDPNAVKKPSPIMEVSVDVTIPGIPKAKALTLYAISAQALNALAEKGCSVFDKDLIARFETRKEARVALKVIRATKPKKSKATQEVKCIRRALTALGKAKDSASPELKSAIERALSVLSTFA